MAARRARAAGQRDRRIGVLTAYSESASEAQARVEAFREGLQKLGWTEGRNILIDARWATSDAALMQRFAQELVALPAARRRGDRMRLLLAAAHSVAVGTRRRFLNVHYPVAIGDLADIGRG